MLKEQSGELAAIEVSDEKEIKVGTFIEALHSELSDKRDKRGKRHSLVFFIVGFVLATLCGRQQVSSIHRFIKNRVVWLGQITGIENASVISRAHMPRLLNNLDWEELNKLINQHLGIRISETGEKKWIAIDGKCLCGTQEGDSKQSVVLAIEHESRKQVGQARQIGTKSSEIPVVRELLKEGKLDTQKVSLDAHHFNPTTTTQVKDANGVYLIQTKENQPILSGQCSEWAKTLPCIAIVETNDKGHGRLTKRTGFFFD